MRQTSILTAAAAFALTYNFPRLVSVHELTKKLESGLKTIGINITSAAETCMVRPTLLERLAPCLTRFAPGFL